MTGTVTLYTYWRSQAAFRVRIALRLKGIAIEKVTLDLLRGDQFAASYQALNPEGVVPTLMDGAGEPLTQSLAILEYLDEKYPDPPLLPTELRARAHARAIAQMVAMDAHPFIVPRANISRRSSASTRRRAGDGCATGSTRAAARSSRCSPGTRAPVAFASATGRPSRTSAWRRT